MLPLVSHTAKALTRWLGPRFGAQSGDNLRIGYDVDAVDAPAPEREAVWARLNAATFLSLNEKRAAAGYGTVEGENVIGGAAL